MRKRSGSCVVATMVGAGLSLYAAGDIYSRSEGAGSSPVSEVAQEQNQPKDTEKAPKSCEQPPARTPRASRPTKVPMEPSAASQRTARHLKRTIRGLDLSIRKMNTDVSRIGNIERRLSIPRR